MLNPFIQIGTEEDRRKGASEIDKSVVQAYGHSLDTASPRPAMGLWLGRLLIRMGQKLAKEDMNLKVNRERA